MAVPLHALNAIGYFTTSTSKLDFAMYVFFSNPRLKPAADFKEKF